MFFPNERGVYVTPSTTINANLTLANPSPTIFMPNEVHKKIMYWVRKAPGEISGLGTIKVDGGKLLIQDVILLPQKNSGSTTDIEAEDVCKAMYRLRESGGSLNYWFHSHSNMDVFWSGTDRETINLISNGGWCLATVFNKSGKTKTLYAQTTPVSIALDDLKLEVEAEKLVSNELWDKEFEENVKNKDFTTDVFNGFMRSNNVYLGGFEKDDEMWNQMYLEYMQRNNDKDSKDMLIETGSIVNPLGNDGIVVGKTNRDVNQLDLLFNDEEKMDLVPVLKKKRNLPWMR